MYLMYADEADQDGQKEYLVYAGVFFPSNRVLVLHNAVQLLRDRYGFQDGEILKSSTGTRPRNVPPEKHAEIKNAILSLAAEHGCKACCYIVPHAIAAGQNNEDRLKFGINTLCVKFNQFLHENDDSAGAIKFDRTTDFKQDEYLFELFQLGPSFPAGRRKLTNVVSIDSTRIGSSHLASITDIVVGAFRFVINEPDKDRVGATLLKSLVKLMWGKIDENKTIQFRERGFCIRPLKIQSEQYQADIDALISRMRRYIES